MEEEDVNIPSKGYDLSFLDNLDDPNFDPFKTKSSVNNDISSTKESQPFPRKPKTQNNKISDVNHLKTEILKIDQFTGVSIIEYFTTINIVF